MYKFLSKNGLTLAFGLGIAVTVISVITIFGGLEEFNGLSEETRVTDEKSNIFMFGILASIAMVLAAFGAAVVGGLVETLTDLKGSLKSLLGVVALIIILVVAYNMTKDNPDSLQVVKVMEEFGVEDGTGDKINAGIILTLATMALAFGALVVSEIVGIFK